MRARLLIGVVTLAAFSGSTGIAGAQTNWAVWRHDASVPGQVGVAPAESIGAPRYIDSVWYADVGGAWKKACWLVRNGDIQGRRYLSPDMDAGSVVCDLNCNCRY